jgi:hypothetical protein
MKPSPHIDNYFERLEKQELLDELKQRLIRLEHQELFIDEEIQHITKQIHEIEEQDKS